jgi:VWFA-related protein
VCLPPDRLSYTAALVVLVAAAVAAQSGIPPPTPSQQPPIRTGVNLVRVDVYPTRSNAPVLDLRADEFEVFEDGAAQRIESFDHVMIQPAGPQVSRVEPGSQRESLQAAANPRSRVFIIFLDTPNVMVDSAHRINEPLINLVDRILGPEDLVGVMTPAMSAAQLTLGRKTQVIEESLRRNWAWGTRFSFLLDEREEQYVACYPPTSAEARAGMVHSALATEMIRRKRERATLEALQDLVRYLHGVREERKAILTVTEGWLRFRENRDMMTLRTDPEMGWQEPVPGRDPIVVGPTGQPTTNDSRNNRGYLSKTECDTDRMRLAMLDNERFFQDILADANRANASFYPIDPRGLAAFDTPIGPRQESLPLLVDRAHLKARQDAMHELAINTDGIAVLNNNDLDAGLKRISDDLTSYYLLGYYSTNTKLDGRFRQIRVRVKRPGVEVRARRGYRAATVEEAAAAQRTSTLPAPGGATSAFTAAMGSLGRIRPDARFRINASVLASTGAVWVAGEVPRDGSTTDGMGLGGTADIEVNAGSASTTTRVQLKPGERTFLTALKLAGMNGGDVDVRARLTPDGGTPSVDSVRVEVGPATAQPLLFRRGVTTGNRVLPAADFRFSRTERLRIEIPVAAGTKPGTGRVLDKAGTALGLSVTVGEKRDETSGQLWITADATLAPLAPGDYAIEVAFTAGDVEQRVVTAIRLIR